MNLPVFGHEMVAVIHRVEDVTRFVPQWTKEQGPRDEQTAMKQLREERVIRGKPLGAEEEFKATLFRALREPLHVHKLGVPPEVEVMPGSRSAGPGICDMRQVPRTWLFLEADERGALGRRRLSTLQRLRIPSAIPHCLNLRKRSGFVGRDAVDSHLSGGCSEIGVSHGRGCVHSRKCVLSRSQSVFESSGSAYHLMIHVVDLYGKHI
jgi:hypothetical protein